MGLVEYLDLPGLAATNLRPFNPYLVAIVGSAEARRSCSRLLAERRHYFPPNMSRLDMRLAPRQLRKGSWLMIGLVLVVAGVAVAATVTLYFLPGQTGSYSGPGLAVSKAGSFDLNGFGAWFDVGFHVNSTNKTLYNNTTNTSTSFTYYPFFAIEDSSSNASFPSEVLLYFMNSTEFTDFQHNVSLPGANYTVGLLEPGCGGPAGYPPSLVPFCQSSEFYFVWIDTTPLHISVSYDVTVWS